MVIFYSYLRKIVEGTNTLAPKILLALPPCQTGHEEREMGQRIPGPIVVA